MGKLEKVVVLTVLFLVALILGVSLNAPEGVAEAKGELVAEAEPGRAPVQPRAESREPVRQAPVSRPQRTEPVRQAPVTQTGTSQAAPGTERNRTSSESTARDLTPRNGSTAGADRGSNATPGRRTTTGGGTAGGRGESAANQPLGPAGVLSTSRPKAATAAKRQLTPVPAPAAAPKDENNGNGFVRTYTDLAPSLSDEFMIYTWKDGDTFAKVSERYFGSRLDVNRLLRNNEGLEDRDLNAGDKILIPVRAPVEVAAVGTGATTYTVQSGDVLGTISTTVYGTSKSWRKIYDANRDQLADPNRLVVGMVLRIPE